MEVLSSEVQNMLQSALCLKKRCLFLQSRFESLLKKAEREIMGHYSEKDVLDTINLIRKM